MKLLGNLQKKNTILFVYTCCVSTLVWIQGDGSIFIGIAGSFQFGNGRPIVLSAQSKNTHCTYVVYPTWSTHGQLPTTPPQPQWQNGGCKLHAMKWLWFEKWMSCDTPTLGKGELSPKIFCDIFQDKLQWFLGRFCFGGSMTRQLVAILTRDWANE